MIDLSKIDYSHLDRPEILMFLFHPRPEWGSSHDNGEDVDIMIPVEKDVVVGARFYPVNKKSPTILLFHGNGEIVADYQDIGLLYNQLGINFFPVDYRGYGRSSGQPTVTAMMRDAHVIFDNVRSWLQERHFDGRFMVMGRSLGSASALELASHYEKDIHGLIIESGFAYIRPLMQLLGIDMNALNICEDDGFRNFDKVKSYSGPVLIIHAERDHLIPYSEGQALYDASQARQKRILKIPKANHNDIFSRGLEVYMDAVRDFVAKIA
ncbi:MAG: alpha/beta hydrolase [Deltaproteobacteria bacterium]|nr:alpha/beta hydrolase [Deltaproteobacteria bacterium]